MAFGGNRGSDWWESSDAIITVVFQMFKKYLFPAHSRNCQQVAYYHVTYKIAYIFIIIGKIFEQI